MEKKQRESEERIRHEKELKLALGRTVEENRIILKPPSGMKNKENKIILKLPSDKKNKNTADSEVQIPNLTLNPETSFLFFAFESCGNIMSKLAPTN